MDLMAEQGTKPVNKYLPPRPKQKTDQADRSSTTSTQPVPGGLLGWLDNALEKLG
jgi:hypothetical protein